MIIPFTIKIPASTLSPVSLFTYEFPKDGVLTKIYVDIPSGWAYTAGIKLVFDNGDIIPENSGSEEYITGDDSNYEFLALKNVQNGEKVEFVGVNWDPSNVDHYCEIVLEVLTPKDIAKYRDLLWGR